MVEKTSVMTAIEIIARGYVDKGVFKHNDKVVQEFIIQSTLYNKYDIFLLYLDETGNVVQLFVKDKSI